LNSDFPAFEAFGIFDLKTSVCAVNMTNTWKITRQCTLDGENMKGKQYNSLLESHNVPFISQITSRI